MSWETRKRGGRYYTRSYRVNGHIVRKYIGGGRIGQLAQEMDALERNERLQRAKALHAEREQLAELDSLNEQFFTEVESIAKVTLREAGYHNHKGQWRKRKVSPSPETVDRTGTEWRQGVSTSIESIP